MIDEGSLRNIEKLHEMKANGILSEAEFEDAKTKLLAGGRKPTRPTEAKEGEALLPAGDDPLQWALLPLKRYAEFTGRSSRREFWMFQLLQVPVWLIFYASVGGGYLLTGDLGVWLGLLSMVTLCGLLLPMVSVQVRRLHDQDRSGWFVLLNLIPYVGFIAVLALMALEGTAGDNRFGPDPKQA